VTDEEKKAILEAAGYEFSLEGDRYFCRCPGGSNAFASLWAVVSFAWVDFKGGRRYDA
jgi:hypothetical protein